MICMQRGKTGKQNLLKRWFSTVSQDPFSVRTVPSTEYAEQMLKKFMNLLHGGELTEKH